MATAAVITDTETVKPEKKTVAICEHIKDDGHRCGTPAIRGRHFCYYHSRAHAPGPRIGQRGYRAPLLETIESLNILIMQTNEALGSGRITDKVAGKLLYSVQLATNLLKLAESAKNESKKKPQGVQGVPGPFPPLERAGSDAMEEVGAPSSSPSFGDRVGKESVNNSVTDELDQPVTEITPAMEAVLAPPTEPEPDPETIVRHRDDDYENDPEMPQTIEDAKRVFLSGKHFVEYNNALQDCDRLSSRYARLTRRLAIHKRAFSILDRNDLVPSTFYAEIDACPEKKR